MKSQIFNKYIYYRTNKNITDAVALKMYNGATGGNYCYWDNPNDAWAFHPLNLEDPPFNYVRRVCACIDNHPEC